MKLSLLFLFVSFTSFSQDVKTVYFKFDEHETLIPAFDIPVGDSNFRVLSIQAHCDTSGSEAYNNRLAMERFNFVYSELKQRGYVFDKHHNNEVAGEMSANQAKDYNPEEWRRVDITFAEGPGKGYAANIESRGPVRQGYAPDPLYNEEETKPTETLSQSAVEKFVEEDSEETLEFDLTILFVNASTRTLEESKPQLYELLEIMQNNPSLHATFHGHVCCQPHYEISEGRARTVAIFLRENGIDANRIDYMGHSNTQPKVWPEVTDEDRKLNRRVTVEFSKVEE
ncbi:MAG: OmpA family protein [Crocinitomicaceae bacterium]